MSESIAETMDFTRTGAPDSGEIPESAIIRENESTDADVINRLIHPLIEAMTEMIGRTNEALERLATVQRQQADHMEALEKQIRLAMPVTPVQAKYLKAAMNKRAAELLAKKENEEDGMFPQKDRRLCGKIVKHIREKVLTEYGVSDLIEVPKCEYNVAIGIIEGWDDMMLIRDEVREWKKKNGFS